jgi:hypothetical protein
MPYVAVCAVYRNEADYLREWIEFHRLMGVERFFLYDNLSDDDHRTVVAPYVEAGIAELHSWPVPARGHGGRPSGLRLAFEHCIRENRFGPRWIAFMDTDEFLFSPTGASLPSVLAEYERWPGVCVTGIDFGTSGHRRKPPGLVIENYLHRRELRPDGVVHYKSIVDPKRVRRCITVHQFEYHDGLAVDENHRPIPARQRPSRHRISISRLRINHYRTKSEEEALRKMGTWADKAGQPRRRGPIPSSLDVPDDEITRYVPALRAALGRGPES